MTSDRVLLAAEDTLPLLQARVADVAPLALVVGDPARAERAAGQLADAHVVGRNREYLTISGTYAGQPVTVASHGVGAAGAAVCFEELLRSGVGRIVRAGTAGGLQPEVVDGELVVATGAVREEGTSVRLVPASYPAVCAPGLVQSLQTALDGACHTGLVLTCDLFYALPMLGDSLQSWADAGVLAVEMELSVLLVLAGLRGVPAAGVFAIDGNPVAAASADMADYAPHRDVVRVAADTAVHAALTALTAPTAPTATA